MTEDGMDQVNGEELQTQNIPESHDWFLATLITFANVGMEIGITLNVKGSVISGILISGKNYFKEQAEIISSQGNGDPTLIQSLSNAFQQISDEFYREGENEQRPVGYIHLRNAKVYTGGHSIPTNQGVYWRCRLSEVSGFTVGNL